MSLIPLQVELPQYSYSFSVEVPVSGSILDIKQEISRTCPGHPRVDGQRLIWKGRILADAEAVEQVWKLPSEPRVVHLAVNPWAWSGTPPEHPSLSVPASGTSTPIVQATVQSNIPASLQAPSLTQSYFVSQMRYPPSNYIVSLHNKALHVLCQEPPLPPMQDDSIQSTKMYAKEILESSGYTWPAVFDEDFPPESEGSAQTAKYEHVMLQGLPFLQLINPDATPTSIQLHALKVLTYTFPLLSIPFNTPAGMHGLPPRFAQPLRYNVQNITAQMEQELERMGAQRLVAQPGNGNDNAGAPPQIRAVPVRALMTPLILLFLRTLLLLYFFSPARKPIFGLMLGAWVVYEAWGAIRGAIGDLNDHERNAPRPRAPREGGALGPPDPAGGNPPAGGPVNLPFRGQDRNNGDIILAHLANINIQSETSALTPAEGAGPVEEPGLAQKIKIFAGLLVLTLHPAVWNRRRATLKEREGRVRTEANARENHNTEIGEGGEGGEDGRAARARAQLVAQHGRRPQWVKDYVERVRRGEWTDD